jgi:hypothetical protein
MNEQQRLLDIPLTRMSYVLHGLQLLRIKEEDGIRGIAIDALIMSLHEAMIKQRELIKTAADK